MSAGDTQKVTVGASELLRELGLLVDGPVRWGAPVRSRMPGVFLVELPGGAPTAPVDIVAVRRWVAQVPQMTIDGEAAAAAEVARRLEAFWLPGEPILYVGRSARAIGPRVGAMYATALGDAKPYSGGHWLKTLTTLADMRVWWAETDAHEEFEDAILTAVAGRNNDALPFANLAAPGRDPRQHGLADSLRIEAPDAAAGQAKASRPRAASQRASVAKARAPRAPTTRARPVPEPTFLSREGLDRLTAELDDLRTNTRPQVIARVKAARELGDLKENGDYEYARKEQSFVEGRILALEATIRNGVVIDDAAPSDSARLGSTLVVESEGDTFTFTLVSSTEANPAQGRISNSSPVGRSLIGARAGDQVTVALPAGSVEYRVLEVR